MDRLFRILLLAICLLLLAAAAKVDMQPAAEFTPRSLASINANLADLGADLGARVAPIDFQATRCDPCRQAMPALDRPRQSFQDTGFTVPGVNMEGSEGPASVLAPQAGMTAGLRLGGAESPAPDGRMTSDAAEHA